jgi:hypothetical protein
VPKTKHAEFDAPKFGKWIETLRAGFLSGERITLRELSRKTGVSVSPLSGIERGHMPSLRNAIRITQFFGGRIEDFVK